QVGLIRAPANLRAIISDNASFQGLCLVKTKSTFEINNLKKRDVTMLYAICLGEITIRHGHAIQWIDCALHRATASPKPPIGECSCSGDVVSCFVSSHETVR